MKYHFLDQRITINKWTSWLHLENNITYSIVGIYFSQKTILKFDYLRLNCEKLLISVFFLKNIKFLQNILTFESKTKI